MLIVASTAFSQSDKEIVDTVRASITKIFLEQASWVIPESFRNSGLSPSDKEKLIQQLANDTATCFADALVEYAALNDASLSDLVSADGSISFEGGSGYEFEQLLDPCILVAWEAAGISHE